MHTATNFRVRIRCDTDFNFTQECQRLMVGLLFLNDEWDDYVVNLL